ncbi:MAG: zinc ABC transporter substrate-binding protein [Candidatus Bathyarchaeia archaeon]
MLFKKANFAIIAIILFSLAGLRIPTIFSSLENGIVRVSVSIEILKSIISPIISGVGEIHPIISGDIEPHSFTLTPDAIDIARESDLIIITGHMKWEEDLVNQVAKERGVSADSISINILNLNGIRILNLNGERNIHGFWLLPDNALIIAKEIKERLLKLKPELSEKLSDNYEAFEKKISNLKIFLHNLLNKYDLYNRSVAIGFYAEHYIAESMGLKVAHLLIGEEESIRPESLRRIYEGFKSGEFSCIIVSDTALLMEGIQNALEKISKETGCPIAYVLTVSSNGIEDYDAIMYYNAGQVYGALLSKHEAVSSSSNIYLLVIIFLLLAIIFETALFFRGRIRL